MDTLPIDGDVGKEGFKPCQLLQPRRRFKSPYAVEAGADLSNPETASTPDTNDISLLAYALFGYSEAVLWQPGN